MNRAIGMALVWTLPLVFAGCNDGGYYDNRYAAGYYGYCQQFRSCGACTPIYGCGWCTYGQGQGICLSDPGQCRTQQFTWTWELRGCGIVTDAGSDDSSTDASSSSCHWPETADTFSTSDAGPAGCLPSTGGNLCPASQYNLNCYGPTTPDSALGCAVVPIPTPSGELFYCCPCAP
jgi:hypothetical protein